MMAIENRCGLCGGGEISAVETCIRNLRDARTRVRECRGCGVQFLHPAPAVADLKQYYAQDYRKEYGAESYYEKEAERDYSTIEEFFRASLPEAGLRVARVKKLLRSTDRILEIGCASGYFLKEVAPCVGEACGTEWDPSYAGHAKKLGFSVLENPEDFEGRFDKFFMFHVLEHVTEPIAFLRELQKKMTDDGRLFIEVPNRDDALISLYAIPEFRDFYYQSAHLWYFNAKSLSYVLQQAGYASDIQYVQRYDLSNHLIWLRDRKPGGQARYHHVLNDRLNTAYAECLAQKGMGDTLFAMAYRRTK